MASKALRINPETPSKKPVVRTQSLHTIGGSHNCGHKLIVGECLNSVSANARSTLPRRRLGPFFIDPRQERAQSQDAYAHQTGYHRNYIGQLERGEKSPSLKALFDFARSFGMQPSELLRKVERVL